MEKINIYSIDGKSIGLIDLPNVFKVNPRKDIIQQASEVFQSRNKQAQGRDKRAGLRNTSEGWGTGHGMSRAPRLKGSGYPTARNVGRVPFAKGGRRAHAIKIEKKIKKKINKKTNKLSLISAISASGNPLWVKQRGYNIEEVPEIPFVIDDKVQTVKKTSKFYSILCDLGLKEELIKIKKSKRIRAGKGKRRGRRYKIKRGILFIINDDFGIVKASRNIPGIEIVNINQLSLNKLAPGGLPGRLIIWTQSAFKKLNKYEDIILNGKIL